MSAILGFRHLASNRAPVVSAVTLGCIIAAGWAAAAVGSLSSFYLFAGAVSTGTLSVAVIVYLHRSRWDAAGPLGMVCVFTFCTFAIGGPFFANKDSFPGLTQVWERTDLVAAEWLGLAGFALLTIGYFANPLGGLARYIPPLPRMKAWHAPVLLLVVGYLARLQLAATGHYFRGDAAAEDVGGLSWLTFSLADLPIVACAIAGATYYFARRQGLPFGQARRWFYCLLLAEALYSAPRGSRAAILTIVVMVLVLRYYGLRRAPSYPAILALITTGVLVVFPAVYAYRGTEGYQQDVWGNLSSAVTAVFDQPLSEAVQNGVNATLDRFSTIVSVAAVVAQPDVERYDPGETFGYGLTAFVPRAIYPEKSNPGTFGGTFPKAYGIIPEGSRTSLALPQVGEWQINFGVVGILGMFIIGGFYRLLSIYLRHRVDDPLSLGLYAGLAWTLVNGQEGIVAATLLGLIKTIAVTCLVLWLWVAPPWRSSRFAPSVTAPRPADT